MRRIACFVAICIALSCTSPDRARAVLEAAGYTQVELTGRAWRRCGDDDDTCTGFTALGPSRHHAEGAVGCGYGCGAGKGCTIRLDP